MKLLERTHGKHAAERVVETSDHEVMERLAVPDDLSGLVEIPSGAEGGAVAEPPRAASTVRWLRWLPVMLLAVVGIVAAAVLLSGESDQSQTVPPTEAPWSWETDGPGSNSLTVSLVETPVPWLSEADGPGGHSLDTQAVAVTPLVTPTIETVQSLETHGPGSNSMDTVWTPATETLLLLETHGPGSNSMGL